MQTNVTMHEIRMEVEEVCCKFCVRKVFDAVTSVHGVVAVHIQDPPERVDAPTDQILFGVVFVKYIDGKTRPEDLQAAVERVGYRVGRVLA